MTQPNIDIPQKLLDKLSVRHLSEDKPKGDVLREAVLTFPFLILTKLSDIESSLKTSVIVLTSTLANLKDPKIDKALNDAMSVENYADNIRDWYNGAIQSNRKANNAMNDLIAGGDKEVAISQIRDGNVSFQSKFHSISQLNTQIFGDKLYSQMLLDGGNPESE